MSNNTSSFDEVLEAVVDSVKKMPKEEIIHRLNNTKNNIFGGMEPPTEG